jgi:uncharacterized protein (TIGR02246 family)
MKRRAVQTALALTFFIGGAPHAQEATSGDRPADFAHIEAFYEHFFNAGDAQSLATLYAEDALGFFFNTDLQGREAIRDYYQGFFQQSPGATVDVELVDGRSFGGTAYGLWSFDVRSPEDAVLASGHAVYLYEHGSTAERPAAPGVEVSDEGWVTVQNVNNYDVDLEALSGTREGMTSGEGSGGSR